jgi:hypothetical protein
MNNGGFFTEKLELRSLLIQLGHNINEIQQEIASLKSAPEPPTMGGAGQLGLFSGGGDRPQPNNSRLMHLERLLFDYLKEYSKANTAEAVRRTHSQDYIEVELLTESYENLRTEVLTLIGNLGGEEKESLTQQVDERFQAIEWLQN